MLLASRPEEVNSFDINFNTNLHTVVVRVAVAVALRAAVREMPLKALRAEITEEFLRVTGQAGLAATVAWAFARTVARGATTEREARIAEAILTNKLRRVGVRGGKDLCVSLTPCEARIFPNIIRSIKYF